MCRRCLEYLPYAKVRTTPGAWLANAIRAEYGPPEGYLKRLVAGPDGASNTGTPRKRRISPAGDSHAAMSGRLRDAYELLEKTRPDAITAFMAYFAAEHR